MLNITRFELDIPCEKDFCVVHASDSHLIFADDRENQRKRELAARRVNDFGPADQVLTRFEETLAHALAHAELFLHTGDVIDFVSRKNLEVMQSRFEGVSMLMCAGNHEFSQYVGEAKEDDAYKAQTFDLVQSYAPNDLDFTSKVVNGVNFVAIDNGYYLFKERHAAAFREEVRKGLPIILLLHNPIYTPALVEFHRMARPKSPCYYLCGAPEEILNGYPQARQEQQRADAETQSFIRMLRQEPLLKAIFAGHVHFPVITRFAEGVPQIVAGGNFRGELNEILIRQA